MSFDPVLWAMKDAPVADVEEWAVLAAMSESADDDGCNVFKAQGTLAKRVRLDAKTVARRLAEMQARGLIARGDQQAAAYIPADRRPVVYDLMIPYAWFPNIDRIQEYRRDKGRPPLRPEDRPQLMRAPERKPRVDRGQPRKSRDLDGGTTSPVVSGRQWGVHAV